MPVKKPAAKPATKQPAPKKGAAPKAPKKEVTPKTIGACVDELYELRAKRLDLERDAEAIKKRETAIKDYCVEQFGRSKLEGARGKIATLSIGTRLQPTVKDWDALYSYVKKHDAWELLQRRVGDGAWRERIEAGEVVPGVEGFSATTFSLTKVGGRS